MFNTITTVYFKTWRE